MADVIYQEVDARISQGDILEIAPHLYLDPPLSAVVEADIPDLYSLKPAPHPALENEGQKVVARCSQKLAVVVTADCEIDKPSSRRWIICPIVPLTLIGSPGLQGDAKRNRVVKFFFLPRLRDLIGDSVVVLEQITTVDRSFIEAGKRIATLSDTGRFGLYSQFIRWLTHWEFKDVKCPTCNCEFDPTLGMSVRPPD